MNLEPPFITFSVGDARHPHGQQTAQKHRVRPLLALLAPIRATPKNGRCDDMTRIVIVPSCWDVVQTQSRKRLTGRDLHGEMLDRPVWRFGRPNRWAAASS